MKNQSQQLNVTYVCPWNGREVRSLEVDNSRVYMGDSGEMVFAFNSFYPACEVVKVEPVAQSTLDAKRRYFEQYGTANE